MARLRGPSAHDAHGTEANRRTSTRPSHRDHSRQSTSSPEPSSSSDKENDRQSKETPRRDMNRAGSRLSSTTEGSGGLSTTSDARKRKAPRELAATNQQRTHGQSSESARGTQNDRSSQGAAERRRRAANLRDKEFYDPEQDPAERRRVRKDMRNLNKELNDNRSEYLKPASTGLQTIIERSNDVFKNVKQTADATIDSRTLLQAADLTLKRATELTMGDASTGIDVDDFVTKCIQFMRQGDEEGMGVQTQRRRREMDEDDDVNDGPCNWAHLGRKTCFLYNSRPCVPSFLLGPLSVQKRVRQQTQRRAREARATAADATRPKALEQEDMDKAETANLTVVCAAILQRLKRIQIRGQEICEAENNRPGGLPEDEMQELMTAHAICDNGGLPLVNFCFNPRSFGQTVENLFYVSFLIREGALGLDYDSRNLPTLAYVASQGESKQSKGSAKNQSIFALDYEVWEDIIASHGIKESLIPHREEEVYEDGVVDGTGFYD